ncbi:MAG: glycosyltransferase family 4 protein [Candidatus Kerfeldbacteria bacterium]|nr:glycosyltransferase family 4 protein [Candidatus Kerfeldbacteria bacterium]
MNIAMIGQKGIPTMAGGVEKHVQELSVRLAAAGHNVTVYTRPWYTPAQRRRYSKVALVSLPSLRSKHADAISHTALAIVHAAFRLKPEVVHIHAVGPALLTPLARVLCPSAKVVVTFHCIDRQHQKWGRFAKIMLRLGEVMAMRFAHEVITVSKTLQDYSYEVYGRQTHYIPNGISVVNRRPAQLIKRKFDLSSQSYILCVARLVRHKGIHHLIAAYQQLHTDKKLVIVGDGAFTDDYIQEIHTQANTNPNIIFTGLQTGHLLEELFSNAYAFVLPSESEGLPIVVLEAAAYGLTVLASDIPANVEIVQHCGLMFRNRSVPDLVKQLMVVLHEPDIVQRTGKLARSHVLKHYLWDDIAVRTNQLYQQLGATEPAVLPRLVQLQR